MFSCAKEFAKSIFHFNVHKSLVIKLLWAKRVENES